MIAIAQPVPARVLCYMDRGRTCWANVVRTRYRGEPSILAQVVIKYPDSAMTIDVGADELSSHNELTGHLAVEKKAIPGTQATSYCCDRCLTKAIRNLAMKLGYVFLDDPMDVFL